MKPMTSDRPLPAAHSGALGPSWTPLLWFGALLAISNVYVLARLADQWFTNEDMSHGPFVPVLAGYVVWQMWPQLLRTPARPSYWGVVPVLIGGVLLCVGPPSLPTFAFLTRVALFLSIGGLVLLLRGWPTLRLLGYPFAILILMVPLPGFVIERVTLPLQLIASVLSEHTLGAIGYSVLREGNVLHLPLQTVAVAEACSGLRSLFSLFFLSQVYAVLFDDRPWMRAVLGLAMIPIAVLANSGRITFVAALGQTNPDWFHGTLHDSTGWVIFVIAFLSLVAVHLAINRFKPAPPHPQAAAV